MSALLELPTEILVHILRYVNLNGDLASLRLCNSELAETIVQQERWFINDLSAHYGIGERVLEMFMHQGNAHHESAGTFSPKIWQVIALSGLLQDTKFIAADAYVMMARAVSEKQPRPAYLSSREPFLLFAVLTHLLDASATVTPWTGDVLAPSADGEYSLSKLLPEKFLHFTQTELGLEELESVIAAINFCSTRLWSTIFLFRPKDAAVVSFGSLSGASFNMDQALLTEHIIWKGPRWVARVLESCNSESEAVHATGRRGDVDLTLVNEGIWRGSKEEGARIAANGLARLLWKKRQEKIEEKAAKSHGRIAIAEMRVCTAIWRGSSGDM